ncbi:MAG: virulence RhuM family protein [Selenomonas sp.]|nr:virulence RhuM family protein [Selenomonas sp.]
MDNIIIYNTDDGAAKVSLYANDGTVWLTQAQISELFNKEVSTISRHIANIFDEHEVEEKSNLRFMQIANSDKPVAFYSLNVILAVGFRVRSSRGTEFRRWANTTLREYLQKGFLIDDERLKNPDGRPDYFDELLARIRDIRASEKRFYQKLRDLFALSVDYDKTEKETQLFFAEIQNKLIFAVTGKTAADLICARADASAPNMALTSWEGTRVRVRDIYTAKNYLTSDEIDILNRIVTLFLESAELRAKLSKTLTLAYWKDTADHLLVEHGVPLLRGHGRHSHEDMKKHISEVYKDFDSRRKKEEAAQADRDDMLALEETANTVKGRKN